MNALPVVTVSRADGGHRVVCSCGFTSFRYGRRAADQLGADHRAQCARDKAATHRTTAKEATR